MTGILIAVAIWGVYLYLAVYASTTVIAPLPGIVVGAALALGFLTAIRWAGSRAFDAEAEELAGNPPAGVAPLPADKPRQGGAVRPQLIICCSGGGIKSASFCLGALERLTQDGIYDKAEAVVAVSGGSYIASAFALQRARGIEKRVVEAMKDTADALDRAATCLEGLSRDLFNAGGDALAKLVSDARTAADTTKKARMAVAQRTMSRGDAATDARIAAASMSALAGEASYLARALGKPTDGLATHRARKAAATAEEQALQASRNALDTPPLAPAATGDLGPDKYRDLDTWIAPIRRLTNYLVSSPRVKSELVMQWLFGVMVALVILVFMLVVVAFMTTQLATDIGLVVHEGAEWQLQGGISSWLRMLGPGIVLVLAPPAQFLWHFIRHRAPVPPPWRPSDLTDGSMPKHFTELRSWLPNLPAVLFKVGCLYLAACILVPAADYFAHTLGVTFGPGWLSHFYAHLAAIAVVVAGYVASLRSAFKGFKDDSDPESVIQQALSAFRRAAAPILAVAIFLLLLFVFTIVITAWLFYRPFGEYTVWVGCGALLVLLLCRTLGKGNLTSLYPFYRDRLSAAFLAEGDRAAPALSWLEHIPGQPRLTLCATANIRDENLLPTGRLGTPFILGDAIGLTDTSFTGAEQLIPATKYDAATGIGARQRLQGPGQPEGDGRRGPHRLTLADAVALSGAAIAPVMGRDSKTMGRYRLLLALANIRLGQWLPNPYWVSTGVAPKGRVRKASLRMCDSLDRSSLFQVVAEAVGTPSLYSPLLYVTDGGHYDNLGLVEALRQRPKHIIMLDGSGDAEDAFPAMGIAIATARIDLGVEVEFTPTAMMRGSRPYPLRGSVRARAWHPRTSETTRIDYIKGVLPAGLSWDLDSYQRRNPGFPATSQKYEVFDEFDFEAYRQLGASLVAGAIDKQRVFADDSGSRA